MSDFSIFLEYISSSGTKLGVGNSGHGVLLQCSSGECKWVEGIESSHSRTTHRVTQAELVKLIRWLVENTYVFNKGGALYRQLIGLPMGTNCAPALANLYLYYYESMYVSRVEEKSGREAAQQYHMTFRLIDDVLSVDNPLWAETISKPFENGGIYPAALILNPTNLTKLGAEFIGVQADASTNRFHTSVYDKRSTFPFEVRRYPYMASLIPSYIPYNVFTGQCHYTYRICSGSQSFVDAAVVVARRCVHNGCRKHKITDRFKAFVGQHVRKFAKMKLSKITKIFCQKLGS